MYGQVIIEFNTKSGEITQIVANSPDARVEFAGTYGVTPEAIQATNDADQAEDAGWVTPSHARLWEDKPCCRFDGKPYKVRVHDVYDREQA